MRKSLALISAIALGFAGTPALAQDATEADDIMATIAQAFTADPLTAEEEARVPLATTLIAKMIPDGWYAEAMGASFSALLDPIMEMAGSSAMSVGDLLESTGLSYEQLSQLSEADRDWATVIIDPAYGERNGLMMNHMLTGITAMMGEMEPALREGMSKAYARTFSAAQLQDIAAFYDTPTGAVFAEKSLLIATDPQVLSASMAPMMMERMPEIIASMEEATANLPAERGFEELSSEDRRNLASLLGVSVEELEQGMASSGDDYWDDAAEGE